MAKTRKRGGGTHVIYFKTESISADPNFSPNYKSCGILTSTSIKAINIGRKIGTNFFNVIGQSGLELTIYEELRNEAINKIKEEMNKQGIERVSSFRVEYIETPSHVIANCYGTALKKR
jgi:uncharacterized protein YbjQ (UPF0145 family)